ncbi:MAG: YqcC family protein [Porticoccus sp.]|nr:YqcC family protein [Porticoccus sp.]
MNNIYTELASRLLEVERVLRKMNCWSDITPSPEALTSTQPFAVDTLEFVEWLQFVFLPRIHLLVEAAAPLPQNCQIAPMAEESINRSSHQAAELIKLLESIDTLLSN